MSKTISAALKAHLAQETTTIATCWRIVRTDGNEYFFTDHDVDIVYDGDTYEANSGMVASSHEQTRGVRADNMEVAAFIESPRISEQDLADGKYDGAMIDIFILNYKDTSMGIMYVAKEWLLGEVSTEDVTATVEIRGKSDKLRTNILGRYSKTCRAQFGDSECGFDLSSVSYELTVYSVTDRRRFVVDSSLAVSDGSIFQNGVVQWSSGSANDGLEHDVLTFDEATNQVTLFLPVTQDIVAGDAFTLIEGCPRTNTACNDRFNNLENFRGEPFIPGKDMIKAEPARERNMWRR